MDNHKSQMVGIHSHLEVSFFPPPLQISKFRALLNICYKAYCIWHLVLKSDGRVCVPQMGSLEERAVLEFEDESLFSPDSASRKTHSREGPLVLAPSPASETSGTKCMSNSIFNSIKVVVFSTKINLLVPFGPAAILVDKFTDNHVSCILS